MAKVTFTYNGDWPVMQPLGAKETALRNQNMIKGEQLLGQVIGSYNQAVVATNHKVLIVKTGLMSGQTFGGKAISYDYRNIMGVEVRTGFASGEFEVIVGGLATPQGNRHKDRVKAAESPNAIVFGTTNLKLFQSMAAQIRMMASQPLASPIQQPVAPAVQQSLSELARPPATSPRSSYAGPQVPIPEQIRQLAELHAAGILTDAEFGAKKAELLSRM